MRPEVMDLPTQLLEQLCITAVVVQVELQTPQRLLQSSAVKVVAVTELPSFCKALLSISAPAEMPAVSTQVVAAAPVTQQILLARSTKFLKEQMAVTVVKALSTSVMPFH
jgi:hypothetical protein